MKKQAYNTISVFYKNLSEKNDEILSGIKVYFKRNQSIILILLVIALATYGFELFNLNITIDEEFTSLGRSTSMWEISIGRWGKYLLADILFPLSTIPFVPLFVTLLFHLGAILIIFDIFCICDKQEKFIIGGIGMSYPGMVFINTFSTANYLVGIGLFCVILSLYIYSKNMGAKKYLALIPMCFAISIYQPLITVLISIYLLFIINSWNKVDFKRITEIRNIIIMILLAIIFYLLISKLFLFLYGMTSSGYVEQFFDINYLGDNIYWVLKNITRLLINVYSGDETIYGIEIPTIIIFLFVLGISIFCRITRSKIKFLDKLVLFFLICIFLFTPFIWGILTRGIIPLRSLLMGIPFILIGWSILGLENQSNIGKSIILLISILCIFQFISSSNHLFASSHLALQEDRVLGIRLIDRIEEAKDAANSEDIRYFEMVGYIERPSTPLISRIETIGASFFGWDQGNSQRVLAFLKILGFYGLEPLPIERRSDFVDITGTMTIWPDSGSVKVFNDTVVVKFSDYSPYQISTICNYIKSSQQLYTHNFCP